MQNWFLRLLLAMLAMLAAGDDGGGDCYGAIRKRVGRDCGTMNKRMRMVRWDADADAKEGQEQ